MISKQVKSQAVFLLLLYSAWLAMMAIHESGHVIAAYFTGATIMQVSIPLLGFSRTDVIHNSHPAIVAWCGPIGGCLIPLLLWLIARFISKALTKPAQFFAGFCLIINGLYVGVGWIDGVGDAGDLIRHGTPRATMVAFGTVTFAGGLFLWHRLGASKPPWGKKTERQDAETQRRTTPRNENEVSWRF